MFFRFFTCICISLSVSLAQSKSSFISVSTAVQDLNQLCETIQREYVYLSYKENFYGFKWSERCENFEEKLIGASSQNRISNTEFALLLIDLIRVFKDAHTGFRSRIESQSNLKLGVGVQYLSEGFWLRGGNTEIERQTGITEENLDQEKLVIESVQGVPVSQLANQLPFVGSQNSKSHNASAASRLSRAMSGDIFKYLDRFSDKRVPWSDLVSIELRSLKSGNRFSVSYPWIQNSKNQIGKEIGAMNQSCVEKEGFEFKNLTGNIFYLSVPTWYPEDESCFEEIERFILEKVGFLRSIADSKLIIDARFNGGGASIWESFVRQFIPREKEAVVTNVVSFHKPGFYGYHLGSNGVPHRLIEGVAAPIWFTEKCKSTLYTELTYLETTRIESFLALNPLSFGRFFDSLDFSQPHVCSLSGVENPYMGETVVLIDRYGYSSNDQFITSIKAADPERVTLVGERTRGGSGGGGLVILENSGFRFSYAIFTNWGRDGKLLEDHGTAPDVFVEETMDSVLESRDPYVDKAIELLVGG